MKKRFLILLMIFILGIVGYIRYTRPLSLPIQDQGEEMFQLSERDLPSAWPMMGDVFQSKTDTVTSETGRILIEKVDKKLIYTSSVSSGVYTYGGSGEIVSIDEEKIINILSGSEVKGFVDYKLEQIDDLITKYDIVVPEGSDYTVAIPFWMGDQIIVRLGPAYAYIDCVENRIDQCSTTYDILFRFSQKMKDGGTFIQTLIGSTMESMVLNHIKYLLQNDPIKYNPLREMLQQKQYIGAEEILQNAMKTEYWIYKNTMNNINVYNRIAAMDMVNIMRSDDGIISIINKWLYNLSVMVLPKSWLFDREQTHAMARYFFYIQSTSGVETFSEDNGLRDYWNGPIWSRPNMIGRISLEAMIPRLTGIHKRLQDMEKLYMSLIQ